MVEDTREVLPDPDTPVTATMQLRGMRTSMSCRLFSRAPLTTNQWSSSGLALSSGRGMLSLPERYAPVTLSLLVINSSNIPLTTMRPPSFPAPGPRSMSQSA